MATHTNWPPSPDLLHRLADWIVDVGVLGPKHGTLVRDLRELARVSESVDASSVATPEDTLVAALTRVAEAIEAGTIQPIVVPEGACVALRIPQRIGEHQREQAHRALSATFPGRKCLVLDDGAELSVLAETKVEVSA